MILLLVIGVFAAAEDLEVSPEIKEEVGQIMDKVSNPPEIKDEVQKYVEKFVEKRGISADKITNVSEVDFETLPKEVNIENVDDSNLAIYKVDYTDEEKVEQKDQIYVITYSVNELKAQGDLIVAHDKRQFLHFGYSGEMNDDGFLQTVAGVEGSLEKGYIMMREGSITGISTSLDVLKASSSGEIEVIIYKNGEPIRFDNKIDASSVDIKKDYDVQSNDVVTFEPGDVISAYVQAQGNVAWQDVITMVEITTIN